MKAVSTLFKVPYYYKDADLTQTSRLYREAALLSFRTSPTPPTPVATTLRRRLRERLTDIINRPLSVTYFPAKSKACLMRKDLGNPRVTESVDGHGWCR